MGLMDAFNADERMDVRVRDVWGLMKTASKAEYLENGIKAGVPTEYLRGFLTGEPVEIDLPESCECCGDDFCGIEFDDEDETEDDPDEEILFEEEQGIFLEAIKGNEFVLTKWGYDCTPDNVKPEREVGKPVRGFETRVPVSWVEKDYVKEVAKENN